MILTEEGIHEFTEKVRINQFNLNEVHIKYSPNKTPKKRPYALINARGVNGIHQNDTYYENLQENIIATDFSWLEPVCQFFQFPLDATIQVDEEGNFDNHSLHMKFTINIPKDVDSAVAFLYNRIKPFVILNEYIDSVQVLGYYGDMTKLYFYMNINAMKVSKLLKEKKLNRSILNQWIAALNRAEKENKGKDQYDNKYEVISGKINMEFKTELIGQYFELN